MSSRNRVFLVVLLVYALAVALLLYRFAAEIDPRYRESAEDSMVETANLVASLLQQDIRDGRIDVERLRPVFRDLYGRTLAARIYAVDKSRVEMRLYVVDARGWVLYDSTGRDEHRNFSLWRDVDLTLQGRYGARTSNELEGHPETAVMYVGAPVWWQGRIVGVATVGRPVESFGHYRENSRHRLFVIAITSALAFVVLLLLVFGWLATPQGVMTEFVRFARAEPRLRPSRLYRRLRTLARTAYGEIRDALSGREYVNEYVQALTHELKSPLSAIRGAGELLQEPMPEAERARFAANVMRESARIQTLIERMLELAALERRRGLERVEPLSVAALVEAAVESARAEIRRSDVTIEVTPGEEASVDGDRLLLVSALVNLIDNAVDFSPPGGCVEVSWRVVAGRVELRVHDYGTGIPNYARGRVFEKFYSLARPHTGKKGTGLGLPFVREVADLHDGSIELISPATGGSVENPGTEAVLRMPRSLD